MIAPNPRIREAQHLAEELEAKRERVLLKDGKISTVGVPLSAEERDWLLVYLAADKRMKERIPEPRPMPWWRRQRRR